MRQRKLWGRQIFLPGWKYLIPWGAEMDPVCELSSERGELPQSSLVCELYWDKK